MQLVLHVLVFVIQFSNLFRQYDLILSDDVAILIESLLNIFHFVQLSAQTLSLLAQHLVTLLLSFELLDTIIARRQLLAVLLLDLAQLILLLALRMLELLIRFVSDLERLAFMLLSQLVHFAALLDDVSAELVLSDLLVAAHILNAVRDIL